MDSTAYPRLVPLALPFHLFQVCLTIDKGVPAGKNGMVIMVGTLADGSWSELQHSQVAIMSMATTAVNSIASASGVSVEDNGHQRQGKEEKKEKAFKSAG
jgi:hypothetical protein